MALSPKLLEIMVCPKCKGQLAYLREDDKLTCDKCKLAYPIEDDIPVMLIDEATPLD